MTLSSEYHISGIDNVRAVRPPRDSRDEQEIPYKFSHHWKHHLCFETTSCSIAFKLHFDLRSVLLKRMNLTSVVSKSRLEGILAWDAMHYCKKKSRVCISWMHHAKSIRAWCRKVNEVIRGNQGSLSKVDMFMTKPT